MEEALELSFDTLMMMMIRMGRSCNKNGRRKDSKKGFKRKFLHHKTSGKTKNQKGGCGPEGCITPAGVIRGWKRRAENRDEWRRLMREAKAKARKGLQPHIWNGMLIEICFKNRCLVVLFFIVYRLTKKRHFKRFPKTCYMGS